MDRYQKSEKEKELMRGFDLGNGATVTMGYGNDVSYFFTNKTSAIKKSSQKALLGLKVEISSVKSDDEELLKKLYFSM